jgi:methyl-accepting chemotaxis protein
LAAIASDTAVGSSSAFMNTTKKNQSIPRQLLLLLSLAASVTLAAVALYYFNSLQTFKDSSAVTTVAVARLNQSYDLLERISGDLSSLQQLLRQTDPDEIELAIKNLEASQKNSAALIGGCGEAGAGVQTKFNALVALEKTVLADFIKGDAGLAYEKFLQKVSPQGGAVLEEIRKYHEAVQAETQQALALQQNQITGKLRWRAGLLALVLVFVMFAGWRLKNRITETLCVIVSKLVEISGSSANSAELISTSSQTLAEGSSEQAASIEETSASLEEMASMTKRNADNAQKANALARQTRSAADKGAQDMQAMSAAMNTIKSSSDDIAKIIRTIDEIAFQTNILALNAAVEAARAGEAGMGFAVVADEVRNLAQRSAQAAKETAAKIEGAISNTARGVDLSAKVSVTLNEIVAKAREMDELAAEVAGASREQTQGIAQVNLAVGQMDKVTQGNAASAEESAAAAQELNAQAEVMKQVVGELLQLVGGTQATAHFSGQPQANAPAANPIQSRSRSGIIHWDEARMSAGVESIDAQHQELIRLINELHAACMQGTATENLMQQLKFLGQYATTHFAHEENTMEQYHCPVAGKNKAAHAKFLADYQQLVAQAQAGGSTSRLAIQLKQMLADWLTGHICKIDTNLRGCQPAPPFKNSITKAQARHAEIPLDGDRVKF